jgi:putative copper export protein
MGLVQENLLVSRMEYDGLGHPIENMLELKKGQLAMATLLGQAWLVQVTEVVLVYFHHLLHEHCYQKLPIASCWLELDLA